MAFLYVALPTQMHQFVFVVLALLCLHVSSAPHEGATTSPIEKCCEPPDFKGFKVIGIPRSQRRKDVCDAREVTLEKKRKLDNGLDEIKVVCDLRTGKWKTICAQTDSVPKYDEIRMTVDTIMSRDSRDVELVCTVILDGDASIDFSWTTTEDDTIKPVQLIDSPAHALRGNRMYSYKKSSSVSMLIIKNITGLDFNEYTCKATISGHSQEESVELRPQNCRPLSKPDNGDFEEGMANDYQRPGTSVTPTCVDGYVRNPETADIQKMKCEAFGGWTIGVGENVRVVQWETSRHSICQKQRRMMADKKSDVCQHTCEELDLPNGTIKLRSRTKRVNGRRAKMCVAESKCDRGYSLKGATQLKCDSGKGQWVGMNGSSDFERPGCVQTS